MYTIAKAKAAIKDGIRGYLLKDEKGNYVMSEVNRLPFYLEGSPGIGKTEIVKQIAQELHLGYVSFSLVHHTRNSLLGLPVIKELENGDKYTCYTMSEIIAKVLEEVEKGYKEGVLLLDEFPCMSETIMPTMLAFLQTKNIGTHSLPEGWVIVLCGNPPEYNKTARTFDAAIVDRIRKLKVEFQPEVFLQYGKEQNMHGAILDYLKVHRNRTYYYQQKGNELELVTCRGWENVSHMLKAYEMLEQEVDEECIFQYLKAEEVAADFFQYYKQYISGLDFETIRDILCGRKREHYIKKYQEMNVNRKWKALQYMLKFLKEEYAKLSLETLMLEEVKVLIPEIEKALVEKENWFDSNGRGKNYSLRDVLEIPDIFGVDLSSGVRPQLVDSIIEEHQGDARVGGNQKRIMERAKGLYEAWYRKHAVQNEGLLKKASSELQNLLLFVHGIDNGNALGEMVVQEMNKEEIFLRILSEYPNAYYLKLCSDRYNVKIS